MRSDDLLWKETAILLLRKLKHQAYNNQRNILMLILPAVVGWLPHLLESSIYIIKLRAFQIGCDFMYALPEELQMRLTVCAVEAIAHIDPVFTEEMTGFGLRTTISVNGVLSALLLEAGRVLTFQ